MRRTTGFLLLIFWLASPLFDGVAWSQPKSVSLSGLTKEDVLSKVGEPDSKQVSQDQTSETWRYGTSLISFVNGKVLMWSDAGGLAKRLARQKVTRGSDTDLGDPKWLNPWTPQKVEPSDVIEDLE